MSLQALTWVIYEVGADIKYSDFRVLLILADMANQQGNGAYPSRSTIGRLTGYSVRTVSYALKNLESAGLIRRGDQRIVSGLGGYKPTVWNLNMDRMQKLHHSKPTIQQCKQTAHQQCNEGCKKQGTGVQTAVQ